MNDPIIAIVFIAAVTVHLASALFYVRTLLARRGGLVRLAFAARELALFVLAVGAVDVAPWTAWPFAIYAATALGLRLCATRQLTADPVGAARLLFRS